MVSSFFQHTINRRSKSIDRFFGGKWEKKWKRELLVPFHFVLAVHRTVCIKVRRAASVQCSFGSASAVCRAPLASVSFVASVSDVAICLGTVDGPLPMNHRSHRFVGYLTKTPVRKKKCEVLAVLTLVVLFLAPALAQDDELNEVIPRSKTSDEKQTAKCKSFLSLPSPINIVTISIVVEIISTEIRYFFI